MARKLIVCIMIFLTLFTGFYILDYRGNQGIANQGIVNGNSGVLQIQQTESDGFDTANTYTPFGSREYVRIVPR